MIRVTAKLICVLAGLYCLVALADRWGWTEPLWAKCWPQTVLPRRPSPAEVHAAELQSRMETLKREIAALREARSASAEKRRDLLVQLRDRVASNPGQTDMARLQADNPVAFALVRSIDAEDRREAEDGIKLAELEAQQSRLEARRIAANNGVSLVDTAEPTSPSDGLRTETSDSGPDDRYRRIIREARDSAN